jgi:DNA-binding NarL/FixJ family response regulator
MRFLIVDDQKLLRQTMALVLKKLCDRHDGLVIHAQTACCAEEAMRKHRRAPFDIVSMDQYFDQMLLSRVQRCADDDGQGPMLVMSGAHPELNKDAYVSFKRAEAFRITADDGLLLGTDVIEAMRQCGDRPIIFTCTASDDVNEDVLRKPYTADSFVELMEAQALRHLRDGSVTLDGDSLRKNAALTLFDA